MAERGSEPVRPMAPSLVPESSRRKHNSDASVMGLTITGKPQELKQMSEMQRMTIQELPRRHEEDPEDEDERKKIAKQPHEGEQNQFLFVHPPAAAPADVTKQSLDEASLRKIQRLSVNMRVNFPKNWQPRALSQVLPGVHPNLIVFQDMDHEEDLIIWSSRAHRKGLGVQHFQMRRRFHAVSNFAGTEAGKEDSALSVGSKTPALRESLTDNYLRGSLTGVVSGPNVQVAAEELLQKQLVEEEEDIVIKKFKWHGIYLGNVSWQTAFWFIVGSAPTVAYYALTFVNWPDSNGILWANFVGNFGYLVGSFFQFWEAVNPGLAPYFGITLKHMIFPSVKLTPDESKHVQDWRWIAVDLRSLSYWAAFFQWIGSIVYQWSAASAFFIEDTTTLNYSIQVNWTNFLGSVMFTVTGYIYTLETQPSWWRMMPTKMSWHIAFWSYIGAIMFTIAGYYQMSPQCDDFCQMYQNSLVGMIGGLLYLISSYMQILEAINQQKAHDSQQSLSSQQKESSNLPNTNL
eukprot:TRINITY_DN33365_c0_g1_i1.p1 TRINITY_DN33365_c0_g1~~TRINITY_DN33365_c0_g1_i1.p1  ORF type:complete len:517 (-),score=104.57 TRINITY_DN33365_c0_g1_i1:16-1566(-)